MSTKEIVSDLWERLPDDVSLQQVAREIEFIAEVRAGFEAWLAAGVKTPILVPSSISGGQMKAIEELVHAFD